MSAPASVLGRALRPLLVLLLLVAALAAASWLRTRLGIEWTAESVRAGVRSLGVWAPLGFLTLVTGRQLLALPSVVVLTAAGLLFGAPLGALLGGLGIAQNACLLFGTARWMGRDWVLPRLHERFPEFEERARSAGPPLIAVMTGYPMGVMTPFHFAAGATGIAWRVFLLAVVPAALLRAACYAFLGANLLALGSPGFWLATALLGVAALLPLAHPEVRRRLLGRGRRRPGPQRGLREL